MPTRDQMDEVQQEIEEAVDGRFTPDGGWMRSSDTPDAVPWNDLTYNQQVGVLVSEVSWPGFDQTQIADVSTRVIDGEPSFEWMGDIVASDQREHDKALAREQREEKWAADHGRLPTPEELARDDRLIAASMEPMPERITLTDEETDRLLLEVERLWPANDNRPPDHARENLLADSFMLNREIGFVGFRREFFDDADAVREWPDPIDRENGLREAWDGEANFTAFRERFAGVSTEDLGEYRDTLGARISQALGIQADHYESAVKAAREISPYDLIPRESAKQELSPPRDTDRGMDL